uniref:Uncharacterized protein n=1 Tax=Picea glauca TaxID=3330 RepID=A0A101LYY4_PICGL|nr:hypothetical protein ABT39_MTgene4934 [Picea glauca]QHR88632.1 hypothetical protein Q903MT_gene2646 [Picea sitchensis]
MRGLLLLEGTLGKVALNLELGEVVAMDPRLELDSLLLILLLSLTLLPKNKSMPTLVLLAQMLGHPALQLEDRMKATDPIRTDWGQHNRKLYLKRMQISLWRRSQSSNHKRKRCLMMCSNYFNNK